jgi:forkhead box protein J2/3
MRYPGGGFDEQALPDANGQIDWRLAWHNELANLQRLTAEQDKLSGADDWYRLMLVKLKLGLFTSFGPPGDIFGGQPAPQTLPMQGMLVDQPDTSANGQVHEQ